MFNGPVFNNETIQCNARAVNEGGISESLDEANALYSRLTGTSFELVPSSFKGGTLYSGAPGANGDLSWTRGSDAFRTNASGVLQRVPWNLVQYSEQFNDVWWSKDKVTISANAIISPNGTATADLFVETTQNGAHSANNYLLTLASGSYTFSVYAKAKERSKILVFTNGSSGKGYGFDLANGTMSSVGGVTSSDSYSITNVGDGWYRCTITNLSTTITGIGVYLLQNFSGYTYTGDGTSGLFFWGAQLVEGTTAQTYLPTTDRLNFPRLSYMYGSSPAMLLEPQRTNLFFNSGWTGGGATPTSWTSFITGSTTAVASIKNNSVTAYRFSGSTQRAFFVYATSVTSGTTYAVSAYVESVTTTGDVSFMLSFANMTGTATYYRNGVLITASTTIEAGYTYTMLFVPSANASGEFRIGMGAQGNATANYVLSMPQYEQGAYATTFILTPTSATATRVADSFSRNNIYTNGLISASGGTLFFEFRGSTVRTRDNFSLIGIGDSASIDGNSLVLFPSSRFSIAKYVSGTPTPLTSTNTDTAKVLFKWNGSTADIFINGIKVISATSFPATNMQFLTNAGTGIPMFIQQMALFPAPLSDTDCASLTGDYTDGTSIVGDYERYVSQKSGAVENLSGVTNLIQNLK